jgi:hypothetical protein
MAATRNEHPSGRPVLNAGLAVVAAATGAAFGRLFLGPASARTLAVAGLAAVGVAALLQRRHLAVALGGAALGLVLTAGILVFPRTTVAGLPTLETIRAAARALTSVGQEAGEQFTPAVPLPSLFTASLIAVWCAASAAHALAVRSGTVILALLPPAGLLLFASSLAADGPRFGYALVFLLGALGVLLGSGMRSIAAWGTVLPAGRSPLRHGAGRHAAWLGSGALVAALVAPGILPGLRSGGLLDVERNKQAVQLGGSPIVDIRPALIRDPALELFRVRAKRPAYWRMLSLERFDGRFWTAGSRPGQTGRVVTGTTSLPGATLPGIGVPGPGLRAAVDPSQQTPTLEQEIEITGLKNAYLPAAFQPIAAGLSTLVSFDARRSSLAPLETPSPGYTYAVRSVLVVPTPDQLRAAADVDTPEQFGVDASLPATVPPSVHDLAHRLTRTEPTPYEKVLAIQRYLRSFTYDLRAPPGHGVSDIVHFLERSKRGYCEQFAGSMAVLVRALGYGTRVAVGFTPGTQRRDGRFAVTTSEAHTWTEVFFPGFGWLAFEPTPTRSNPVSGDYTEPATAILSPGATQGETALTDQSSHGSLQRDNAERSIQGSTEPEPGEPGERRTSPLRVILALASGGVVLLLGRMVGRRWLRRRRIRRARSAGAAVVAAYDAFEADAGDVGMERRIGETPSEYARRLRTTIRLSDGHLELLTGLLTETLYAGRVVPRSDAHGAAAARRRLARDLHRHVGMRRTLTGLLGLRPR